MKGHLLYVLCCVRILGGGVIPAPFVWFMVEHDIVQVMGMKEGRGFNVWVRCVHEV